MLPLKVYNSLPLRTRKQIVKIVFGHMGEEFQNEIAEPFHHNFDYEGGKWYQLLLSHCTYNDKTKVINVTVRIPLDISNYGNQ